MRSIGAGTAGLIVRNAAGGSLTCAKITATRSSDSFLNGTVPVPVLTQVSAAMVAEQEAHWVLPASTEEQGMPLPPAGHTSLLRIAEVPSIGLFIGDASWVTWLMPDEDLAAARFDRVQATMFVG